MYEIKRGDQVIIKESFQDKVLRAKRAIQEADAIVIGAGAGLSDAAGIHYAGPRFTEPFQDFIRKYGMTDMYTAGFYPFPTQEEKWAYWARHIHMNRYAAPVGAVYRQLLELVKAKPYFVITTNVDAQFYKAGFGQEHIWVVQGDYGKNQCAKGCHDQLYDNQALVEEMMANTRDCRIPEKLVPKCPVCGGDMEVNIRKDLYFVQDQEWYDAADRYEQFVQSAEDKNLVFLELGVGYNTPTIIRLPFEKLTAALPGATLIRVNLNYPEVPKEIEAKSVCIGEDIATTMEKICAPEKVQ